MAGDSSKCEPFPVWDFYESWLIMGHDGDSFWRGGMRDFKRASNAYMKANGIEKPREVTEQEFDDQYKRVAEKLKKMAAK